MSDQTSNMDAARAFVEFGLDEKAAGRRESASGPGSSHEAAAPALQLIRRIIQRHKVRTMLDLGCGDWNWIARLGLPDIPDADPVAYRGWDASQPLIEDLTARFGRPGEIEFELRDITTEPLPEVDLIIARDVLFHLPRALSVPLVNRIRASCRLFVSTSFLTVTENTDTEAYLPIEGWGFYRINLNVAPFGLGNHMISAEREDLCSHKGYNRYVCLYDFRSPDRI